MIVQVGVACLQPHGESVTSKHEADRMETLFGLALHATQIISNSLQ